MHSPISETRNYIAPNGDAGREIVSIPIAHLSQPMSQFSTESTATVWSRYWRKGVAHSCCLDFGDHYQGAVAGFWAGQFETLRGDALIVDVGTGNGAITRLAREFAREHHRHFRIHGVDAADIDPAAMLGEEDITYHGGTSMLALPFAEGSVDLLCSQFAIEYVPWQSVLVEIARVCGREGRFAAIVHSRDSQVHATTVQRIEGFVAFLESGLLANAGDMARMLAVASSPGARAALKASTRAEQMRNAFNAIASEMLERIEDGLIPATLGQVIRAVVSILRAAPQIGAGSAVAAIADIDTDLHDELYRLRHLREAALTPEALEVMVDGLREHGFPDVRRAPVDEASGTRYGWNVSGRRRA